MFKWLMFFYGIFFQKLHDFLEFTNQLFCTNQTQGRDKCMSTTDPILIIPAHLISNPPTL